VVGDQTLVAADDPGEVADAGDLAGLQGKRDREPGRVAEGFRALGPQLQLLRTRELLTDPLGLRQVETEEIAGIGVAGDATILQTIA